MRIKLDKLNNKFTYSISKIIRYLKLDISARSGFSLVGLMMLMLVISIAIAASVPLITQKSDIETNISTYVKACITDEGVADINSTACQGTILGLKNDLEKDYETILYLLQTSSNADEIIQLARQACDQGGERACRILVDRCVENSSNCDVASVTDDVRYYLELDGSDSNTGRAYIETLGTNYYNKDLTNFVNEVDTVCQANTSSTACDICCKEATATYEFYTTEESLFTQIDDTLTDFSDGTVSIGVPEASGGGGTPWAKSFSYNSKKSNFVDMDIDSSGNVYIVGNHDTAGSSYVLFMKLDSSGNVVYYNYISNAYNATAIKADSSGNAYITCFAGSDPTALKINSAGDTITWTAEYTDGEESFYDLALDSSGDVILGTSTVVSFNDDNYLLKLRNSDGQQLAISESRRHSKFANTHTPYRIAIDSSTGNIHAMIKDNYYMRYGVYNSSLVFQDRYLFSHAFANNLADETGLLPGNIWVKPGGETYLVGCGKPALWLEKYGVITKFSNTGSLLWSKQVQTSATSTNDYKIYDIWVDNSDYIYITGTQEHEVLGGTTSPNLYVIKLSESGSSPYLQIEWQRIIGDSSSLTGTSIKGDNNGSIYVAGYSGSLNNGDNFLIKISDTITTDNSTLMVGSISDSGFIFFTGSDVTPSPSTQTSPVGDANIVAVTPTVTDLTLTGFPEDAIGGGGGPNENSAYITTKDDTQISNKIKHINSITITQTDPDNAGTDAEIRWMVSFDGRTTWKYHNGSGWQTDTLANFSSSVGSTKDQLESALTNYTLGTGETLDFAIWFYANENAPSSPSVDRVEIQGVFVK